MWHIICIRQFYRSQMNWGGGGSGVALLTQPLSPRLFNMLKIPLQEIYFWETKV